MKQTSVKLPSEIFTEHLCKTKQNSFYYIASVKMTSECFNETTFVKQNKTVFMR